MKITKKSCITGKENTMDLDVTVEQIHLWQSGVLVQKAMPHLSMEEREFLITGMTSEEQTAFYKKIEK